jgi:polyhydroxyalkanoate synthesis regulator phasin
VADSFQAYINMVTGVTKSSQAKAAATARALLKQAGLEEVATETNERVTKLTEEIMHASRTNRELLQHFVMSEVDKVATRLGLARADEVQALRDEVAGLRAQLNATARTAKFASAKATTKKTSARKAAATVTPSNKATKRAPGRKAPDTAAPSAESSSQPGEE